jgi:hypothetical protein
MPWSEYPLDSITIPADAGDSDPRIFIGQDDPILQAIFADAGIVFYFDTNKAFVLAADHFVDVGVDQGTLTLYFYGGTPASLRRLGQWGSNQLIAGLLSVAVGDTTAEGIDSDRATAVNLAGSIVSAFAVDDIQLSSSEGLVDVFGALGLTLSGAGDVSLASTAGGLSLASGDDPGNLAGTDVRIHGVSAPRGFPGIRNSGFTAANFTPIGTQVTGGFLTNDFGAVRTTRRYRVTFEGIYSSTAAGDAIAFRIYEGSISGTIRRDAGTAAPCRAASENMPFSVSTVVTGTGAAATAQSYSLGVRKVAGGGTCSVLTQHAEIEDIGPV